MSNLVDVELARSCNRTIPKRESNLASSAQGLRLDFAQANVIEETLVSQRLEIPDHFFHSAFTVKTCRLKQVDFLWS